MRSVLCPVTLKACATCDGGWECELKSKPPEVNGPFRGILWALAIEGLVGILLLFLILVAVQ